MRKINFVLVVLILFLVGVVIFLITRPSTPAPSLEIPPEETEVSEEPAVTLATYRSERYGFSFQYPEEYDLMEYTPTRIAVGHKTELGFDSVADIALMEGEADAVQSFEEFVLDQARLSCDADGPTASISCTEVKSLSAFGTSAGVTGQKFYLNERTHTFADDRFEDRDKGPYYTFNTSQNTPGAMSFLMIHNPVTIPTEKAAEMLLRNIALSLAISNR